MKENNEAASPESSLRGRGWFLARLGELSTKWQRYKQMIKLFTSSQQYTRYTRRNRFNIESEHIYIGQQKFESI
jgi:hypothetical protein